MSTETILFDEYEFMIELLPKQISIILTDHNDDLYGTIIEEDDLYIKPISKLYLMIIKSLNKEDKYSINLIMKTDKIICKFTYSCDILEIEEPVVLNKGLTYSQMKKLYKLNQVLKQNQKDLIDAVESGDELICKLREDKIADKESFDQKLLEMEKEFDKLTTDPTPLLPKSTRSLSEFIKNNPKIPFKQIHKDEYIIQHTHKSDLDEFVLITNYGKIVNKVKEGHYGVNGGWKTLSPESYVAYDFNFKLTDLKLVTFLLNIISTEITINYNCNYGSDTKRNSVVDRIGQSGPNIHKGDKYYIGSCAPRDYKAF